MTVSTERLGKIMNLGAASVDPARDFRDYQVSNRYKMQEIAARLLPDRPVSYCSKKSIPRKNIEIWRDNKTGKAHLKGAMRCRSAWICPVCGGKIAVGRQVEIQEGIAKAKGKGYKLYFLTLTARHSRDDTLSDLMSNSKKALRIMRQGRPWKRFSSKFILGYYIDKNGKSKPINGHIDATELTWGFSNGWHVHFHMIYMTPEEIDIDQAENEIYGLWSGALAKVNMDCDRDHGVMVQPADEKAAGYLVKWGLSLEITSKEKPGREGNFSPFQLLDLFDRGYKWAGYLFQEYADATKGLTSLRWARELRDHLGLGEAATDEELVEEIISEDSTKLLTLTSEQYKSLIYTGIPGVIGLMLVVAERGREALLLWLDHIGVECEDP